MPRSMATGSDHLCSRSLDCHGFANYNTRGILAADVRAAFATDYTREGQRVSSNQSISSRDAYAAKRRGIRAVVCMSELVPGNKVEGVRDLGAEVRIVGKSQDVTEVEADRLIAAEGG